MIWTVLFDGQAHGKNTLLKAQEDDVAITEIPDESGEQLQLLEGVYFW